MGERNRHKFVISSEQTFVIRFLNIRNVDRQINVSAKEIKNI